MTAKIRIALSAFVSIFAFADAQAAEPVAKISAIKGKVLLSQGQAYGRAESNEVLPAGSHILISAKSSVSIFYKDANCTVTYSTPGTVNVAAKAPCKPGEQVAALHGSFAAPANGGPAVVMAAPVADMTPVAIGLSTVSAEFLVAAGTAAFPVSAP